MPHPLVDAFRGLTREQITRVVDRLAPDEIAALNEALPSTDDVPGSLIPDYPWQQPPEGDWWGWAIAGGRGSGKTLACASWVDQQAEHTPGIRIGIIAPTLGDARATCVLGETGLRAVNPRINFNRSTYEGSWPNGSTFRLFGAYTPEDRRRLRGPQWHRGWLEEFSSWRQLDEIDRRPGDEPDAWEHVTLALRLGEHPRFVLGSTPKRRRRYREVIRRPDVVVTRGTTYQAVGLAQTVRDRLVEMYEGTRLGRQELLAEELDDVEGAQWNDAMIAPHRVESHPELARIIVGVDPAGSTAGTTGIVAVGVSRRRWPHPRTGRPVRHGYVLADVSKPGRTPEQWAADAVDLYHDLNADSVVAEANFGGDMVASVIAGVDSTVPVKMVHASRGKKIRAEPVAAVAAQGLLHHVGHHPALEEELTTWVEDVSPWSPNRLDSLVWACAPLLGDMGGQAVSTMEKPTGTVGQATAGLPATRARITR